MGYRKKMKNRHVASWKWEGGGPEAAREAMASGSLIGFQEI